MIEPQPAWVRQRAIPEATTARVQQARDGIAYLLSDAQILTRADGHDDWFRSSNNVINRSGLESAGQLSVTFNPAFERVAIHFIHLIRDGKVIDLTHETQFNVVEREDQLDDGIVNGSLKAMANLRDVRVGDIVDYAVTVHTRTSLWPNHAFYQFSQRFSEPLGLRSLRLIWPTGIDPRYKAINSGVVFATRATPDGNEWEWVEQDPPALQGEDNVPAGAFQWGRIDVSTMADWGEVSRWAKALYDGDESLTDDFTQRLDKIANSSSSPGDRLTEATRYIQDNIRYVGEELGEGSYVPRRPRVVLTRGYGDCKDKSLLLAVALRRLGIDAVPALVSTGPGDRLPDRLPSPLQFDHVIVRAVLDGKVLWIDPTGTHRGGRGLSIVPSDLGYALPIRAGQKYLERIGDRGDLSGQMTVLEQFAVDEATEVPLTLHVETQYSAARADSIRARWATTSAQTTADGNLQFYRQRFPGLVESKPLELRDDRDSNIVAMIENYTMPREAFVSAKIPGKLITRAYALQDMLPERQARPRVQPLALADHFVNEQTIELRVKNRVLEGLEDLEKTVGNIGFTRRTSKLSDGLRIVYRINTGSAKQVPAAEAEAVYALSDKIRDELGIEFYIDKAGRGSEAPTGIDAVTWAAIKPDMEKIVALAQKPDQPSLLEALSLIADISARIARPSAAAGLVEGMKGAILAELQRTQAALDVLRSATAQYDGNPPVFKLWLGLELHLGTGESFVAAIERTQIAQPQVLAAVEQRWVQAALQKIRSLAPDKREAARQDICIALNDSGWHDGSRTAFGAYLHGCALTSHSLRGEISKARKGLAQAPSIATLLALAIDRRHQALWPAIDRENGDGFRLSLEREATRAATGAKANPKDFDAVTYQMQTLRALGRFEEAMAAGKTLANDRVQVEVGGEQAFWLVNEYAQNLRALGRPKDALAAMDALLALGVDRYPELVPQELNRAEMLVAMGQFQLALDSLDQVERLRINRLNPFGKMWLWAGKSCALHALGRAEEAKIVDDKLAAKPEDNWSAATNAAACRNDPVAIADMLVRRLRDSDARSTALSLFIVYGTPEAHTPFEQQVHQVVAKARAMPEVRAEFGKYGRLVRYAGSSQGFSDF